VDEALAALESGPHGLEPEEAAARAERFGPNQLPQPRSRTALERFAAQFNNVLIFLLIGSAIVTAALGHFTDTAVILLVVLANALVGYVQEGRAESDLAGLRRMISPQASVTRGGHRLTVPAAALVLGDVVLLEPGDKVPADLRMIRCRNLTVDESILTGESMTVEKSADPVPADAPLADRNSMAFSGTLVAAGQGTGVAVATGTGTQLGRIGVLLESVDVLTTPLLQQINRFGRQFAIGILGVAVAIFGLAYLARDYGAPDAFMAVVGIAVAAIPEGLPAVMTITLAVGVRRMARRQAIIRRLPAVETLGSVSVICTDKTGTLTRNEMTVRTVVTAGDRYEVGGEGYDPRGGISSGGSEVDPVQRADLELVSRAALLCNDASLRLHEGSHRVEGDPMEGALVALAGKAGLDERVERGQWPRTDEIPFDAQHRFMATLHHSHDGQGVIFVKGAPERILAMCDRQGLDGTEEPLDRAFWEETVASLAAGGQRVIALARRAALPEATALSFPDVETGLTLLGMTGIMDPPREDAIAAVSECRKAGIQVKMITGDHVATAAAIGAQLGMEHADRVATGADLEGLDATALQALVAGTTVFARTTPEQKLRIVEALQATGETVAMTGDGVNDAPALRRADVGIAMGVKGTEVAKDSGEMVLADDNFASIVAAVAEGRIVYDNLKKVIAWTLPTGGGEASCLIVAILAGVLLPLSPLHILWVNTVTAVALGLALAFEPAEPDIMARRPRRRTEAVLSPFLVWRIVFVSALFAAGAFAIFEWVMSRGGGVDLARTTVVNLFVVFEMFYLFSIRYLDQSSIRLAGFLGTPAVLVGVFAAILFQAAFTYLPIMNSVFVTAPLGGAEIAVVIGGGIALFVILELEKAIRRFWRHAVAASAAGA
jgi:magnesium-transporting ATPase (P-type)